MSVQAAASQTLVEGSPDGMARSVNRIIGGIVSYARWPDNREPSTRSLCIVGTPRLTNRIAPVVSGGPTITTRRIAVSEVTQGSDCNMLFIGRMPPSERQQLIGWVRGRPVLTMTDDDSACIYGAMFCLDSREKELSFSVNLDAVARGPLRIDPRVLKIGRDEGASR